MIYDDEFEWDEDKDAANIVKHGYSFEQAKLIFEGDIYTVKDPRPYAETRWISVGFLDAKIILFVVYTWRGHRKRIISAREAEAHEARKFLDKVRSRRRR